MFATLLLATLGFFSLCAGRDRHQRELFERPLPKETSRGLRIAGWAALGIALFVPAIVHGWAQGPLLWTGCLTVAATLAVITLTRATSRRKSK